MSRILMMCLLLSIGACSLKLGAEKIEMDGTAGRVVDRDVPSVSASRADVLVRSAVYV